MPTLNWIGKEAVINHHLQVPYRLIRSDDDASPGAAGAGNLLIEGDNLHALKALLPYYRSSIKMHLHRPTLQHRKSTVGLQR